MHSALQYQTVINTDIVWTSEVFSIFLDKSTRRVYENVASDNTGY